MINKLYLQDYIALSKLQFHRNYKPHILHHLQSSNGLTHIDRIWLQLRVVDTHIVQYIDRRIFQEQFPKHRNRILLK